MKLLLFVTLCYGFWWPEPVPGRVEWHTAGWEMFRLANDILDYHFGSKVDCQVQYHLGRTVIITCPIDRQPPNLIKAYQILPKIPKAVEREQKRARYNKIDLDLRDLLVALWNRCSPTNMTWNEIIDQQI